MKYCPECGTKLDRDKKYCSECGITLSDNKKTKTISSKEINLSDIKSIHVIILIVAIVILLFLIISIYNGSLQKILIPSEKPEVEVQSCTIDTGWGIPEGFSAKFTTGVKNVGNGWAVGCTAKVTVTDQNGETEYTDYIPVGRSDSGGTYYPLYENEYDSFTFTADYEMVDSYLNVNILLSWSNTDGDEFSEHYSKVFYL